jgi:tRNA pseudouridine55 synthase
LGDRIGTGATLAYLTRTRSGGFDLAHSLTLESFTALVETQSLSLAAPESALSHLPTLTLPADLAHRWQQGQKFPPPLEIPPDTPYRVLEESQGNFLGIGQLEEREEGPILKAKMVLQSLG